MVNKCHNPEHRRTALHTTPLSPEEKEMLMNLAQFMRTSKSNVMRQALFAFAIDQGFALPSSAVERKGNDRYT
jgi:predicted transcriptional regulator